MPTPPPLEKEILKQCLEYLTLAKIRAWRTNSGAMRMEGIDGRTRYIRFTGAKGCSDILGVLPGGRFLAVETKRPGEKPTPEQQGFLDAIVAAGGLALVVTSVEELRADLREEGYCVP